MDEALPEIDVAVPTDAAAFIAAIAAAAVGSGRFSVDRHPTFAADGLDVLNFRFLGTSPHAGLGFQLIADEARLGRIAVELRAARWQPNPVTADVYTAVARDLLAPLLATYNKQHGAGLRLRIGKAHPRRLVIGELSRELLDRFATLANRNSLHPLDWRRFYDLVSNARQQIPTGSLRTYLQDAGFPRDTANKLVDVYEHLWAYKRHT